MHRGILEFFNGKAKDEAFRQQLEPESLEKDEYLKVWDNAALDTARFCPDVDCAWTSVKTKLKTSAKVRTLQYYYWAAACVGLLAASYLVFQPQITSIVSPASIVHKASGEVLEITLPDASKVWLKNGSEISYSERKPRNVSLKGEAFFMVSTDSSNPFTVTTNELTATVLGTQFNINSDDRESDVQVVEGKVLVGSLGKEVTLGKGQQVNVSIAKQTVKKSEISNYNFMSWKTGVLVFANTPISIVLADIERHYNIDVDLADPQLNICQLSLTLKDLSVDESLDIISSLFGGAFSETNGKYILTGTPCQPAN